MGAVAALLVAGAAAAFALTSGGADPAATTTQDPGARAASSPAATGATTTQKTVPPRTVTQTKTVTTAARDTSTSAPAGVRPAAPADDWPSATDAYTVIVRSSPDRTLAAQTAADLTAAGYAAGVLRSDHYSHLRPGYWVAFSGVYATLSQARAHASQLKAAGHGDAYVRFVNGA